MLNGQTGEHMSQAGMAAKPTAIAEFKGFVECPLFAEESKLSINVDGLMIAAALDLLFIPYAEISDFSLAESVVEINTAAYTVKSSRMGQSAQWFYQKLYSVYNDAVLKVFGVEGGHIFEAKGDYITEENGAARQGQAVLRLYEDCLCILPPDENARRIPLCFLSALEKSGFTLSVALSTGERYTFSKLGRELDNLERLLTDNLRALRERTLAWHRELTPNLSGMQAAMAAKLMPLGTATPFEKLMTAPALATALEEHIRDSRMAQTYPWLRELCGGQGLYIGALPPPEKEETAMLDIPMTAPQKVLQQQPSEPNEEQSDEAEKPQPVLWVIAPDHSQRLAAVELALANNEAAATYLYRVEGKWEDFARLIDRALEAVDFQRELILMPEVKLSMEQAMLVKRTPALALLRRCFAGRAIHSSPKRWRRDIEDCLAVIPAVPLQPTDKAKSRFCTNCGAQLLPNAKFCGQCGCPK